MPRTKIIDVFISFKSSLFLYFFSLFIDHSCIDVDLKGNPPSYSPPYM